MKKGITIAEARGLADTKVRVRWKTTAYWRPKHHWYHHLPFVKEPERRSEESIHEAVGYPTVIGPIDMSMKLTQLGVTGPGGNFPCVDCIEDADNTDEKFEFVEWEVVEDD